MEEKKYPIGGYAKELLRDAYELGIMTEAGNIVPTFENWFDSIDPLAQQLEVAREEDAVEFAEWIAINNWVFRNDKTTWHWGPIGMPKEEWIVCTSSELYVKFKQQKEK